MNIIFLRSFSIILVIFVYRLQTTPQCEISDYNYACPKNDPVIVGENSPSDNSVTMECQEYTSPGIFDMDIVPKLNASDKTTFKLKFCYLNTTFNSILEKFNMTNVTQIEFEAGLQKKDRIIEISKETFESLQSLDTISLTYSRLNLSTDFLENTPHLVELYLFKNELSRIGRYFNNTPNLKILELSRNKIGTLPDRVFENLNNLKELHLFSNRLVYLNNSTFHGLTKLQFLNLNSNKIEDIAQDTFSQLNNLMVIDLSYNKIKKLDSDIFRNNNLIEKLHLNYNNLQNISENAFRGCVSLQDISLIKNELTTIEKNTFQYLKQLKILNLSENKITSLPEKLFVSLVNLEVLNLSDNQLSDIGGIFSVGLGRLKELDLSQNRIAAINHTAFNGFSSLIKLDLSYNRLLFPVPITQCKKLEEIFLNNNLIWNFPLEEFFPLVYLRKLNVSYNNISEIMIASVAKPRSFRYEIDFSHNQIRQVDFSLEFNAEFDKESSVKAEINLDDNPIECDCSNFDLIRRKEIGEIHPYITIILGNLTCSNDNETLIKDLEPQYFNCPLSNQCPHPCKCSKIPYNETIVVDCSSRNLTFYLELDFSETKHNAIKLNMSDNQLKTGPTEDMDYENVTHLDLSKNHISEISWIPTHAKEINLNGNKLKGVSSQFINMLKNSSRIHLEGNLWECDCGALELQLYLKTHYLNVNSSDVYCHESQVQLIKINDLCKVSSYLTILLPIVLTVLLLLTIAFALYYRYEEPIKAYLYSKNMFLWFVTEEELDKDKKYDAFISYSHEDANFVENQLIPELENGEPQFKVCFHVRDWVVGDFIAEQIVSSVKNSRRTVIVLSNHFTESDWGQFEFRTAHSEAVSERRARVIVIIYGDLNKDKLDDEIKSYIKTNTYVKWGDKYFWRNLKYALPHSKKKNCERNNEQELLMCQR